MPTLFNDPRSGGVKKSSGVNVLPIVAETWAQIRDDSNSDKDYLIASFVENSKTDITIVSSGSGGVEACAAALLENKPCYGGVKLRGRFVTFFYVPEGCPPLQRGRGKRGRESKMYMCCLYSLRDISLSLTYIIFNYLALMINHPASVASMYKNGELLKASCYPNVYSFTLVLINVCAHTLI